MSESDEEPRERRSADGNWTLPLDSNGRPGPPKETRWPKGTSGNPSGRRAGSSSVLSAMKRMLAADPDPTTGEGRLTTELAGLTLVAMRECLENRDPDVMIELRPIFKLIELLEDPKIASDTRRDRIVLLAGTDEVSLIEFMEQQRKAAEARKQARIIEAEEEPRGKSAAIPE